MSFGKGRHYLSGFGVFVFVFCIAGRVLVRSFFTGHGYLMMI